jgi:hypothetical protein
VKRNEMQLIVDRPEVKGDTERKGVDPVGGMKRDQAMDRAFQGHSAIYGQIIALMLIAGNLSYCSQRYSRDYIFNRIHDNVISRD